MKTLENIRSIVFLPSYIESHFNQYCFVVQGSKRKSLHSSHKPIQNEHHQFLFHPVNRIVFQDLILFKDY
jgi:hypothetical protein